MIDRRNFVGASAALLATTATAPFAQAASVASRRFPRGFLWGASTAGHQIEGNNINADMWLSEQLKPQIFVEPSGDALNSFELWRTDLDLVKSLGLNAYRFSLEWSRIEPEEGQFSIAMLDHYKALIEGCRQRGIAPVVTFNHFTTPLWFAGRGGWTHPQSPAMFARFCERAARHLAAEIGHAITLNEPNTPDHLADHLPGFFVEPMRANFAAAAKRLGSDKFTLMNISLPEDRPTISRNLKLGHKAGRDAIKAVRPDLPVGVALAIIDQQAQGENSLRDSKRAQYDGAWLEAAKDDDFVGVQNYERKVWDAKGLVPPPKGVKLNMGGGEVYPASLAGAVRYAHAVTQRPILVTEHGIQTKDDALRQWLIPQALLELHKAMDEGVPVQGYLHWTLTDNFEWNGGFGPTYGLCSVDRKTFRRTPKPSAAVLRAIARRNAV